MAETNIKGLHSSNRNNWIWKKTEGLLPLIFTEIQTYSFGFNRQALLKQPCCCSFIACIISIRKFTDTLLGIIVMGFNDKVPAVRSQGTAVQLVVLYFCYSSYSLFAIVFHGVRNNLMYFHFIPCIKVMRLLQSSPHAPTFTLRYSQQASNAWVLINCFSITIRSSISIPSSFCLIGKDLITSSVLLSLKR